MAATPKKIADRLSKQLKAFQEILRNARDRDINESDTVTIVTEMLAEMFGFNKFTEITSEQAIKGTYCDLAVKVDGNVWYLVEIKAIGLALKENHLRQATNYGANHGIPWVVLTNGVRWEIHHVTCQGQINCEQICSIDILELNPKKSTDIDLLYLLCKESHQKNALDEFRKHGQIMNRFVLAAIIQSEPVLNVIRREIRRMATDAKVSLPEIATLMTDVLKRDVIEGDAAKQASKRVNRASGKALRKSGGTSTLTNGKDSDSASDADLLPTTADDDDSSDLG